jgi:D-methionine transport system substrate-binding protein
MEKLTQVSLLVLFVFAVVCSGVCDDSKNVKGAPAGLQKTTINFATNANCRVHVDAMIPLMEAKGYTIKLTNFDDPISIDVATEEGSIDANYYQHLPYMNNFNRSRGGHLVMVKPYLLGSVMGMFSKKYKSIDALPDGGTVTLAMDGSNKDRAIRMMRDYGLVTLSETPTSGMYTLIDIINNPKKLKFVELDLYQLPRSMDEVDASIFSAIYLITAGQDLSSAICFSKDDVDHPIGVVVRSENKDAQWLKDLMEAISSDQCRKVAKETYKGGYSILF